MDTKPQASHDLDMSNDKLVTANNKSVELQLQTSIPLNDQEPYVASPTTVSLGQQTSSHTHTLEGSSYYSSLNCNKSSGEQMPSISQCDSPGSDQLPINQSKNVGKPINNLEGSFFA